jgi:biopolymer transport protein ExbD
MRFSRERRGHRLAEISTVPLIDLFLNILVFFLVTTTFGADSVFFVDLPQTSQSMGMADAKQVLIAISSKGEIAVNNRRVDPVDLKDELSKVPEPRRKAFPVIIRADRSALHGSVVSVIDVVRQVGFENVGMATKVIR